MALTACRECGQQVSTEAASCPSCGISQPVPQPSALPAPGAGSSRRGRVLLVGVLVLAVVGAGYTIGKSQGWFPVGNLDSSQVEATIAARYSQISGHTVDVECPSIPQQKGKISDCRATVAGTDQSTMVFVTQIDDGGHFSFQAENASVLVGSPDLPNVDPVPSSGPDLSAEDAAKQNDKGWVLETYTAGGSGTINARIKNANGQTMTAFFTMTLLNAGSAVATWHGTANSVAPGAVVSVTMLTADDVPAGVKADDMQFQADTSFEG